MIALLLAGCPADVGEGKPKAEVVGAPTTAPPAAPAAPAAGPLAVPALSSGTRVAIDPKKSSLGALGAKVTATHPITFHTFDGAVGLDGDQVAAVAFAAEVASLESDAPRLTAHLKKPDFLDAATFPTATFASTEVKAGADRGTHTVIGDLTIRGQTRRVSFPATIAVTAAGVTANAEFVIDRHDFGVEYPGKPDDLVQDNVVLKIAFVAPRT
jgi:polyisoprenoid-binding protein YceI